MNKITKVIGSLENDIQGLNIVQMVLQDYKDGLSVKDMAEHNAVTPYEVNKVLYALQLRRKKKHRAEDSAMFEALLTGDGEDAGVLKLVEDSAGELVELQRQLTTKDNALTRARFELNRLRATARTVNRHEHLEDTIVQAFERKIPELNVVNLTVGNLVQPNTPMQHRGLVVALSDWHIGEEVDRAEVPSNEYNYAMAYARVDKVIDEILMYPKQSDTIDVASIGDMLRGQIHGGLYQSEDSFVESISRAVDVYVYLLKVLSETYDVVRVHSITGNHDRVTENVPTLQKNLDYTRLIDGMVSKLITASGIENVIISTTDTGYILEEINGANIMMFHGDTLRRYKPWDANQRSLLQDISTSTCGAPYRHAVSGHTHSFAVIANQYNGMNVVNGTLVGSNTYGTTNGMRDVTPSQTIMFVNGSGDLEDIKAINLSNVQVEG